METCNNLLLLFHRGGSIDMLAPSDMQHLSREIESQRIEQVGTEVG